MTIGCSPCHRSWRGAVGALILVAAAGVGCGGDSASPNPPPPPPPPPSGRIASAAAGNQQVALVGQAVPVAPAVRVVNSAGGVLAGIAVTFAVGAGGGTVTGGAQTTGADGVATVGSWVLGAAGNNSLVATVADATAGSPVTFTATGQDQVVAPAQDSTINGTVVTTRFEVPAGVTVTLGSDVVITSTVRVTIAGTLRGDCRRLEVDGAGELVITGTVDNSCVAAGAAGPPLKLVARGGYSLSGATLRSSGPLELTNDPTLTDASTAASLAPATNAGARIGTDGALLTPPCAMANTQYLAVPARAAAGAIGGTRGGDGDNALPVTVRCRGQLVVNGGVQIVGQHGGNGAQGFDASGTTAMAEGGKGGIGGIVRLTTVGDLVFTGTNRIESGGGGEGGRALANGTFGAGTPAKAARARAIGGEGGAAGSIVLLATGALNFGGPTELVMGVGGKGGDGIATGARGTDAAAQTAQSGGDAEAVGGAGGVSPELQFAAGAALTGQASVSTLGGVGGLGGQATAVGGIGGSGTTTFPIPGEGGRMTATGGQGGESRFRRFGSTLVAPGGAGGHAVMEEGYGGNAGSRCVAPPGFLSGEAGGRGGDMIGTHGAGGAGATTGTPGDNKLVNARGGGRGGHGWPDAGVGGQPGTQTMSKPPAITGPAPFQGQPGFKCLGVLGGSTGTGYVVPQPGLPPCRTQSSNVEFVSFVNIPVTFTVTFDPAGSTGLQNYTFGTTPFNPNGSGPGVSAPTPAYDEPTHQFAGARRTVYSYWDYCSTTGPFSNAFSITATVGGGAPILVGTIAFILNP